MSSPSAVRPICHYLQAFLNTAKPVAVFKTDNINMIATAVSVTVLKSSRGIKIRAEMFVQDRLSNGNRHSE